MLDSVGLYGVDRDLSVDPILFKEAMTQFASGVTIPATIDQSGRPWGFTASAFCSLSLAPPLVLVCLASSADCYPIFKDAGRYAIHILSAEQEALALRFAQKRADKFAGTAYEIADDGLPALPDALARVTCAAHAWHEDGDHAILVGRVIAADANAGAPLLHFRRGLWRPDALTHGSHQDVT